MHRRMLSVIVVAVFILSTVASHVLFQWVWVDSPSAAPTRLTKTRPGSSKQTRPTAVRDESPASGESSEDPESTSEERPIEGDKVHVKTSGSRAKVTVVPAVEGGEGVDDNVNGVGGAGEVDTGAIASTTCEAGGVSEELPFDGLRRFRRKCLKADTNRLEVVDVPAGTHVTYRKTVGILIRDVCALGHYPKELATTHTVLERQKRRALRRKQQQSEVRKAAGRGGVEEDGDVEMFIMGHRCATRDASRMGNKYTPTFHSVMVDWTAAILGFPSKEAVLQDKERLIFYEDVAALGAFPSSEPVCFELLLEREEHWRWFPGASLAASFRQKLWAYFGLWGNIDAASGNANKNGGGGGAGGGKSLKSGKSSLNGMPLVDRRFHEIRTVPFAQQRRTVALVLRRDEDRHFQEASTVEWLQSKFGSVLNISLAQWDRHQTKGYHPPTYREQARALADCDVFITAHGAALSSIVFMRPGTIVIELFPHYFRYAMYEELAEVLQLEYVAFEGRKVSPPRCCRGRPELEGGERDAPPGKEITALDSVSTISLSRVINMNGARSCKKCDIHLEREDWYYLIKDALASTWLRRARYTTVHGFDKRLG